MKDKKIPSFEEFYTNSEIEYWNKLAKKNLSQQTIDKIKSGIL